MATYLTHTRPLTMFALHTYINSCEQGQSIWVKSSKYKTWPRWKWLTIKIVLKKKQWHYIVKGITNVPFCPISSKYSVDFDRNPRITGHSSHFTAQIYFDAGLPLVWILVPVCQVFPFVFKPSDYAHYILTFLSWDKLRRMKAFPGTTKYFLLQYFLILLVFVQTLFTLYFRLQTIPNYLNDPLTFLTF